MDNKIMLFEKQIERSLQKQISDNAKELKLYVEMEVKDLKFVFSNLERGLQKTDKAVFESAGKVERMEKGLREQITFISKINDSVQVTD
jgi:thiamine kinase-like enzyme